MIKPIPSFDGVWDDREKSINFCHQLDKVVESIDMWSDILRSKSLSNDADIKVQNNISLSLEVLKGLITETHNTVYFSLDGIGRKEYAEGLLRACDTKYWKLVNDLNATKKLWYN